MLRRQQQEIHAKKGMARRCAADEGEKENKVVMEERPPEAIAVVKTKKRSKKPQQSQQPSNVELEHILQGVSTAQSAEKLHESLKVLRNALEKIKDSSSNSFIRAVESLLVKLLVINFRDDVSLFRMKILRTILECLVIFWSSKYSNTNVKSCFREIFPWLLDIWKLSISSNDYRMQILMLHVLSSLVRHVKHSLIQSDVIPLVVRSIEQTSKILEQKSANENLQELMDLLFGFIKDLTFRTDDNDQRYLYRHLLNTVMEYGCGNNEEMWNHHQPLTRVSEAATATLWNWATVGSLTKAMAGNKLVWNKLRYLWTEQDESTSKSELFQRNLSAIVGTLVAACTVQHKGSVATEDDSILKLIQEQTWLVPCLLNALEEDNPMISDKDYRRRCMRTIRCIASCPWGRVFLWKHSPSASQLGTILLQVLQSNNSHDTDTQIQACQTLTLLLPTIRKDVAPEIGVILILGPSLEVTLIQIVTDITDYMEPSTAASNKLVLVACQTLCTSLRYSPWRRGANCFSNAFFEQILAVLHEHVDQLSYHVGFSELLAQLLAVKGGSSSRRTRIRGISPVLASFPAVVELLTTLLSPIADPEFDASRQNAVNALTVLVNDDENNKKPLAANENLLTALVNVCLMTDNEGPLKDGAKQLILALVPEL